MARQLLPLEVNREEGRMSQQSGRTYRSYIAGSWADKPAAAVHEAVDPGDTTRTVSRSLLADTDDVDVAVRAASDAASGWAETSGAERADAVYALIGAWRQRIDELAEIVTLDMGKPLAESRGEATRAIGEMRFWAGEALRSGGRTLPSARRHTDVHTRREPIGPVAAITPWNFPILSPIRKIVPALMCGCPVVLKPALQAAGASVVLSELVDALGLPAGAFNLLVGRGGDVGSALVAHPDIAGVTFTGSTDVGLRLATEAARRNARLQLEMGGKNAAVVASYGDLEHAAREITAAAFTATGQRCTSISRVIVVGAQRDDLEAILAREAEKIGVGHGLVEATGMGPLSGKDQFDTVCHYVDVGQRDGARVLTGGRPLRDPHLPEGYYYPPTVLTDVAPGTPLATEEVFGPVLAVIPVDSFDAAIRVNDETRYGLTASIFTDDLRFADRFVASSRTGMVHVNHGTVSEGHVPFGGVKDSGQGAYAIGDTAIDFYTSLKAVYHVHPH